MKLRARERGYTLVETMIVVAISSLLMLVGMGVFQAAQDFNNWNYHTLTLQKELRRVLTRMAEEIRESSPSSPAPITTGSNNITFEIPKQVSGAQMSLWQWTQIRYGLCSDSTVIRTVDGESPNCQNLSKIIGNSVQSMNFTYPLNAQSPRTVQIQITGTRTTLKRTITATITGQVTLRNP